ncbi:hypothetical protein ACRARG_08400 [Pseudooceanicola sp. C21-150M6]|uniref:hypothetical protein n=1 Tax=Pseudooceanicola sp. C21-150M6 TaxID=3434355 RepID=UPI003D7F40C2
MEKIAKPSQQELRKAQAALDALNVAYAYFDAEPRVAQTAAADYQPYGQAA